MREDSGVVVVQTNLLAVEEGLQNKSIHVTP